MEFETVGRITMRNLDIQVGRQVYDMDSSERTLFRADTASDTKTFRDESNLGVGIDLDTEFACADHRAGLLAFLTTFLHRKTLVKAKKKKNQD